MTGLGQRRPHKPNPHSVRLTLNIGRLFGNIGPIKECQKELNGEVGSALVKIGCKVVVTRGNLVEVNEPL